MLTIVDLIIVIMVMLIVAKMKFLPGAVCSAVLAGPGWALYLGFLVAWRCSFTPAQKLRLTEISIKFTVKAVPGS